MFYACITSLVAANINAVNKVFSAKAELVTIRVTRRNEGGVRRPIKETAAPKISAAVARFGDIFLANWLDGHETSKWPCYLQEK